MRDEEDSIDPNSTDSSKGRPPVAWDKTLKSPSAGNAISLQRMLSGRRSLNINLKASIDTNDMTMDKGRAPERKSQARAHSISRDMNLSLEL